jgi:sulfite reductase beta subunit-like hemoprotein
VLLLVPAPNIPAAKRAGLPVDLERLAAEGTSWLTPEDRYALKTHGVCTQVQSDAFMMRIRVTGGRMTPVQAFAVAELAEAHALGWVHLSTRQNVELHHVAPSSVLEVLRGVEDCGLTNRSACGHTLRNVMACPDAGVGLDEPFDCLPDALATSAAIVARSAELNCVLPSRINMAFGGCPACAEHARINDVGFESRVAQGELGYRVWAGGSLGVAPSLAVPLVDFLPRRHVLAAAEALIEVFVEHGDLDNPKQGRLKFVVQSMGEAAFRRAFLEHLQARREAAGYEPEPLASAEDVDIAEVLRHVPDGGWSSAVRPQRRPGLAMVSILVPLGDLTGDELRGMATLARFGDGHLYLTRNQNLQLRDVPVALVADLRRAVGLLGLGLDGADSALDVRACTGSDVCALAITASPATGRRLVGAGGLERNSPLRVHVSGCPNSCAQHQAADLGLAGGKVRINGANRLGYTVFAGADLVAGRIGTAVGRVADEDVEAVVDGLIGVWEVLRHPGERLGDTLQRVGADAFAAHVASIAVGFAPGDDPESPAAAMAVGTD